MHGKIIRFDDPEVLAALERLAKDKSGTFQEIADEAFGDLLKKYNRPTTLLGALKQSVKHPEVNDRRKQTVRRQSAKAEARKRTTH